MTFLDNIASFNIKVNEHDHIFLKHWRAEHGPKNKFEQYLLLGAIYNNDIELTAKLAANNPLAVKAMTTVYDLDIFKVLLMLADYNSDVDTAFIRAFRQFIDTDKLVEGITLVIDYYQDNLPVKVKVEILNLFLLNAYDTSIIKRFVNKYGQLDAFLDTTFIRFNY